MNPQHATWASNTAHRTRVLSRARWMLLVVVATCAAVSVAALTASFRVGAPLLAGTFGESARSASGLVSPEEVLSLLALLTAGLLSIGLSVSAAGAWRDLGARRAGGGARRGDRVAPSPTRWRAGFVSLSIAVASSVSTSAIAADDPAAVIATAHDHQPAADHDSSPVARPAPTHAGSIPQPSWGSDAEASTTGESVDSVVAGDVDSASLSAETDTAAASDEPAAGSTAVVVQQGDSLWAIAERHLAQNHLPTDPGAIDAEWRRWYAANIDVVGANPDLIHPGQELQAPPLEDKS